MAKKEAKKPEIKVEAPEVKPVEKSVSVRCLSPFWDLQENCQRDAGAEFIVTESRADQLTKLHLVVVL